MPRYHWSNPSSFQANRVHNRPNRLPSHLVIILIGDFHLTLTHCLPQWWVDTLNCYNISRDRFSFTGIITTIKARHSTYPIPMSINRKKEDIWVGLVPFTKLCLHGKLETLAGNRYSMFCVSISFLIKYSHNVSPINRDALLESL